MCIRDSSYVGHTEPVDNSHLISQSDSLDIGISLCAYWSCAFSCLQVLLLFNSDNRYWTCEMFTFIIHTHSISHYQYQHTYLKTYSCLTNPITCSAAHARTQMSTFQCLWAWADTYFITHISAAWHFLNVTTRKFFRHTFNTLFAIFPASSLAFYCMILCTIWS